MISQFRNASFPDTIITLLNGVSDGEAAEVKELVRRDKVLGGTGKEGEKDEEDEEEEEEEVEKDKK